jgi:aminoglycoside phosphotransferase (APT) family kinase protein
VQRTIGGWHRREIAAAIDARFGTLISDISHWLNAQEFHQRKPTLLHMDFKLDNLIFAPEALRATTILDWDMGTRGDPLFDLATLLSYWCEPGEEHIYEGIDQMPTTTKGFWTRRDVIHAYATMTGRDVGDLPALQALALLRMGVVFLQLHHQWLSGAARDARYASFDRYALNMLQHARDLSRGKSHC